VSDSTDDLSSNGVGGVDQTSTGVVDSRVGIIRTELILRSQLSFGSQFFVSNFNSSNFLGVPEEMFLRHIHPSNIIGISILYSVDVIGSQVAE